jgi:hypothetical protein
MTIYKRCLNKVRSKREIFTVNEQQAVFLETLQYLTVRQQEESKKYRDIFFEDNFL